MVRACVCECHGGLWKWKWNWQFSRHSYWHNYRWLFIDARSHHRIERNGSRSRASWAHIALWVYHECLNECSYSAVVVTKPGSVDLANTNYTIAFSYSLPCCFLDVLMESDVILCNGIVPFLIRWRKEVFFTFRSLAIRKISKSCADISAKFLHDYEWGVAEGTIHRWFW